MPEGLMVYSMTPEAVSLRLLFDLLDILVSAVVTTLERPLLLKITVDSSYYYYCSSS